MTKNDKWSAPSIHSKQNPCTPKSQKHYQQSLTSSLCDLVICWEGSSNLHCPSACPGHHYYKTKKQVEKNNGTELAISSLNQNLWWIFSSWLIRMKGLSASTISSVSGLTFTACLWYISYSSMNLLRSRITSGLNRMENGQYIFNIINLTAHDHQSRSLWEAIKIKKKYEYPNFSWSPLFKPVPSL